MSLLERDLKGIEHTIIVNEPDRFITIIKIKDIMYLTAKANVSKLTNKLLWPQEVYDNDNILAVYKEINCRAYIIITK